MRIVFVLALLLSAGSAVGETLLFDMYLWGGKIGRLTISKTLQADGSELYVLDSHLKAKVLWITRENTAHMETVFKNGKLMSSYQKEEENGTVKRWNRVTPDGANYLVEGYRGKRTFTEAPVFSVAPIYFQGLSGVTRLFFEPEADFAEVEKVDDTTWQFKASDGSRNVYHFVNGKTTGMEFHVSIATVKLLRVE